MKFSKSLQLYVKGHFNTSTVCRCCFWVVFLQTGELLPSCTFKKLCFSEMFSLYPLMLLSFCRFAQLVAKCSSNCFFLVALLCRPFVAPVQTSDRCWCHQIQTGQILLKTVVFHRFMKCTVYISHRKWVSSGSAVCDKGCPESCVPVLE